MPRSNSRCRRAIYALPATCKLIQPGFFSGLDSDPFSDNHASIAYANSVLQLGATRLVCFSETYRAINRAAISVIARVSAYVSRLSNSFEILDILSSVLLNSA